MKRIVCYSGGKDSTAMLILLKENKIPFDEVLYVDVGGWMWESAKEHNKQVEDYLGVDITRLDVEDEINEGFQRWGFPSIFVRWCTGIKKEAMRKHIINKHGKDVVQCIGYAYDERKRVKPNLMSYGEVEYPLVDYEYTEKDALRLCKEHGFDFGGVYDHHSRFNCWCCPLQKTKELKYLYQHCPEKWDELRKMQTESKGYYASGKTIFQFEHQFWNENCKTKNATVKVE